MEEITLLERNWEYDLYWIIIRQVRRSRSSKYQQTYPRPLHYPDWFNSYYNIFNLEREHTHKFAQFWKKDDEKTFDGMMKKNEKFDKV